MPLVILLDNSLAMCRVAKKTTGVSTAAAAAAAATRRDLSHAFVRSLLAHMSECGTNEPVALVAFSASAELTVGFTTDYTAIADALARLPIGESARLEEALNFASNLVVAELGCFVVTQLVLVTDNTDALREQHSTRTLCARLATNRLFIADYYLANGVDFDANIHINPLINEDLTKASEWRADSSHEYYPLKFPFTFPNKLDIVCWSDRSDSDDDTDKTNSSSSSSASVFRFDDERFRLAKSAVGLKPKHTFLNELIVLNNAPGKLYLKYPANGGDNNDQEEAATNAQQVLNEIYHPKCVTLRCGQLTSTVNVVPSPLPFKGYQKHCLVTKELGDELNIVGFVAPTDLTTMPILSRHHLILPSAKIEPVGEMECKMEYEEIADGIELTETRTMTATTASVPKTVRVEDTSNSKNFAVLLHASLKSENLSAVVLLDDEWQASVCASLDNKNDPAKKTSLTLVIFVPGSNVLSRVQNSAPGATRSLSVKSYNKACIIWYRPSNLMSDMQKIMRNAKKMHEKTAIFYKELNKARRAALSFGFYELFDGMATMFERELKHLSTSGGGGVASVANADAMLQLSHCIHCLRSGDYIDIRRDIQPFQAPPVAAAFHRK